MKPHTTAEQSAEVAITAVRDAARYHKRLSGQHRREAARLMSLHERLKRQRLRELGVTVEPEADSHGPRTGS